MNISMRILIVTVGLFLVSSNSNSHAQPFQLKLDIKGSDIVSLVKEIARWGKYAIGRYDDSQRQRVRDAIPDVIKSMTLLASTKRTFADRYADCQKLEAERMLSPIREYCEELPRMLVDIQKELQKLVARLKDADPAWSSQNIQLVDLTHNLLLERRRLALRTQAGLDMRDVPKIFRDEADKFINSAQELAKVLN